MRIANPEVAFGIGKDRVPTAGWHTGLTTENGHFVFDKGAQSGTAAKPKCARGIDEQSVSRLAAGTRRIQIGTKIVPILRGREFVAWHVTCNTARMMKPAALITLLPLLAGFASTQTFSSHTGWSFSDTNETATDVLVADILNGSGLDNGSQVTAMAAIRVVRVLQGDIAPSANMVLEWRYQPAPFESPAAKRQGASCTCSLASPEKA